MNKFTIFGNPVEHSKSPFMHEAAFSYLKEDACYNKNLLEDGTKLKEVFTKEKLIGANITVPHKEEAFLQADEVRGIAKEICAVNTYVKENNKVIAYNTDAPGFIKAIESFGSIKKVLVLGAGGTSKAICLALKQKDIDVVVVNRSEGKLSFFKEKGIKTYTWDSLQLDHYDLVVNSTSAGLKDEQLPVPKTKLENIFLNSQYAFDCVYGKMTPFLKLAKAEGLKYKDGEDMLLYQGVLALELFVGHKVDNKIVEIMRKALKDN